MKLVRFGAAGAEKPGLVDAEGVIRDLSAHVKDITGDTLSAASLDKRGGVVLLVLVAGLSCRWLPW